MATDTLPTEATPSVAAATPAARVALTAPVLLAAVLGAVIALAFMPLLQIHAVRLWERAHYQFFPWAIVGALILAWSYGRTARTPLVPGNGSFTLAGFTGAWLLLAAAEIIYSPALAAAAALVLVGVVIFAVGGWSLVRTLLPAWAFLWITIPPPLGMDGRIVAGLQTITSRCSSAVLDTLGVLHLLEGNVVHISGRHLLVEEACAGVSSLFSLLACTLFLILWLRRPWLRALVLIVSAIGWVIVSNTIRVVTVAYVFDRWGIDLSTGLKHELLGFGCFGLAVLLIWSTDRLVLFLLPRSAPALPVPRPVAVVDSALGGQALQGLIRVVSLPMAVAFGLLFLLHGATYGLAPAAISTEIVPAMAEIGKDTLPREIAGWRRRGFATETRNPGSAFGEYSKSWVYEFGQRRAVIAIDYPFPAYHVLDVCYVKQGWAVQKSTERRGDAGARTAPFWVDVRFAKAGLQTGFLLYCETNQDGAYLEHESDMLRAAWRRYEVAIEGWRQRWSQPEESARLREHGPVYQFQLFIEGQHPLTVEEQDAAEQLFFQAVEHLRKELFPTM
jgi:exosortase